MTALADLLPNFGSSTLERQDPRMDVEALEVLKLASFEEGYKAGWDDAVKAQRGDFHRVSSDLAQNLQDLSFTYHEAVNHVVNATAPMLRQMVETLLPALGRDVLALHLADRLRTVLDGLDKPDVIIAVSPADHDTVAPMLDQVTSLPVRLQSDPMLGAGQADIRFGDTESRIDLGEVLEGISALVESFLYENEKALKHG
ncbi:ABC transporter ATP-binding protein [Mesobacterium sp. TK19101]|uniref:ABC transporter ATP-binding protein n=1 Tax=Mesobacterium hydrothermale TaxID=3111907 RepID=A0ABU6HIC3_9RHOB|nr:ABC transporter ATP-binding protein [Mesobacterium sp. TK19101]MEC3861564.1 ABC transporter ATP-binding protein [Mesobacterium sp. TK19101]